jgi:ferric iron reductase protein FhuF
MTDDLSRKRELNDAARSLIDDKAFDQAILSLRKRWFEALMSAEKLEEMAEYRAMIKALEAIPVELNVLINDYKKAVHDAARRQAHG